MTIGTVLSDGRFIYQNKNGNLFIEKRGGSGASTFSLLFGGNAVTFAVEESRGLVALLLRNDSQDVQLCVYGFDGSELAEQLCEHGGKKVHPKANTLLWVEEGQYLAVSDFHSGTVLYAWNGGKLTKCNDSPALSAMEQNGSIPFSTLHYLGVLEAENHTVHFYDTQKQKVVESYAVPNRRGRQNVLRTVCSSAADKNFVFIGNDDATLHSVYVTKGSVRKLTPMQLEFAPSRQRHSNNGQTPNSGNTNNTETGSVNEEDIALPAETANSGPAANPPRVICTALSSGQVLVGLDQPPPAAVEASPKAFNQCLVVIRYKYIKRLATLVMVEMAKIRLPPSSRGGCGSAVAGGSGSNGNANGTAVSPTNSAPANEVTLVAISTDGRALVRTYVKSTGEEIYRIETLHFEATPTPKMPVTLETIGGSSASGATAAAGSQAGTHTSSHRGEPSSGAAAAGGQAEPKQSASSSSAAAASRQSQKGSGGGAARGGAAGAEGSTAARNRKMPSSSTGGPDGAAPLNAMVPFTLGIAVGFLAGALVAMKWRKV